MNLARLFVLHAVITFAAGIVLVVAPAMIPSTVGIHMDASAYLVCYMLGVSELALSFLSYRSRKLADVDALRLVSSTFVVFHGSTAILEVYAFAQGLGTAIWTNIALRALAVILFVYFGLYKTRPARS